MSKLALLGVFTLFLMTYSGYKIFAQMREDNPKACTRAENRRTE